MFIRQCNIDKTDRINRIVFGILIFLAALFGFSQFFFMILGAVLVMEGIIGWCGIPGLVSRFSGKNT